MSLPPRAQPSLARRLPNRVLRLSVSVWHLPAATGVRWTQCVQALASRGVLQVAECGPGKVLTGLAKRIDKSLEAKSLATPGDFQSAIEEWKQA